MQISNRLSEANRGLEQMIGARFIMSVSNYQVPKITDRQKF